MRSRPASIVALLLVSVSAVAAVPPAPPGALPSCIPQAPWRRFTNKIVAQVWGHGQADRSHTANTQTGSSNEVVNGRVGARYGRDIVLRFNVTTSEDAQALAEAADDLYLDVWEFNEDWVDIRLAKDVVPSLLGLLPDSLRRSHAPMMPQAGLAEIISQSRPSTRQIPFTPTLEPHSKDLFFSDYQPLSVIIPWMKLMASMFSTHVKLISIGKSWEGREILALRVGVHPTSDDAPTPRRTVVVSGGTHAREWISVSTVLYVANEVITSYGRESLWTHLLEAFDFVFIPSLNPDGYVYTWETDRLWRKNRQATSLRFCHGIDLDRAFGFEWDGDASTSNPCSESYAGEKSWQAVESQQFAAWAKNVTESGESELVSLLDLHSYSQQILYPYSYSCNAAPPTLEDLEEVAMGLAKAMRLAHQGHVYKTTSACEGNVAILKKPGEPDTKHILPPIEFGGGSLLDWFYHELKIKYAFQVKLRDTGSYGFLLPKSNIVPQGLEMLSAVTYLGKFLAGSIGLEEKVGGENAGVADVEAIMEEHVVQEDDLVDEASQWELRRRRIR